MSLPDRSETEPQQSPDGSAGDHRQRAWSPGRHGLTPMTKVEVVVRSADAQLVYNLLRGSGVSGYTSVSAVSGFGHHGYHHGRLLFNDTDALSLIIAVMPDERSEAVIAGLQELFEDQSGVMFVSGTYVSRADYFRSEA